MAHQLSFEAAQAKPGELNVFAQQALPRMEAVYEKFFSAYEQYRVDLAAWDARYGGGGSRTMDATYGASTNMVAGSN